MTKISVIVPIYNVEKYLRKCVDSIINQTLSDIEIFLASDGPDNCHIICDEYEKTDSRIKVIKNLKGYGKSVNECLKQAQGEYIGIVESDDWLDLTMYEKLYKAAKENDSDIAKCSFWYAYDDKSRTNSQNALFATQDGTFSLKENPKAILFRQTIWSAIYKKEFLEKNNIKLLEERISFIDAPFQAQAFLKAEKISAVAEPLYYYYQDNPNQSMQNLLKFAVDGIKVKEAMLNKIPASKISDKNIRDAYIYHIVRDLFNDYNLYSLNKDKRLFWQNGHKLAKNNPNFKNINSKLYSKKQRLFMFFLKHFNSHKFFDFFS